MQKNVHHFETLDILRGFAALSVVIYHVIEHVQWTQFPSSGPLVWFRIGWIGVDLFFVISGFVIGLSAFSTIDRLGADHFRRPFATRRAARIVPLHYLTVVLYSVLVAPELLFNHYAENLAAHLVFLHNLHPALHGAINGSNWSLGVEMQFYLLMLLLSPWLRLTQWWKLLLAFVGIAWAWRFGVSQLVEMSPTQGPFPVFFMATQLPGTLDEFAFGILLARHVWGGHHARLRQPIPLVLISVVTAISLWLCFVWFWQGAGDYWESPQMIVLWRSFLGVCLGLVVLLASLIEIKGLIRRVLAPLYYLGTISYGLYLWHLPVLISLKKLTWLSPTTVLVTTLVATTALSVISWHFFEKQFLRKPGRA